MVGVTELMKSLGISTTSKETASTSASASSSETASLGNPNGIDQAWNVILSQLKEISSFTVKANLELTERVNQLQGELQVWKQARTVTLEEAEREKKQYEKEKMALQSRVKALEYMQGSMVLCVLDGDGNIFADHLLAAGLEGGRAAALNLTMGIGDYLKGSGYDGNNNPILQLWVSIYFNRKGLQYALVRGDVCTAEQFEAFLTGLSQASPRFLLVDVGYGKEAADAKIKEYLQTYSRFPQTLKVFFGGGHDNGYLPTLTALENERLLDKIVLLKGYCEIATELKALRLPTLTIDNTFRGEKLIGSPKSRFTGSPPPPPPLSTSHEYDSFSSMLSHNSRTKSTSSRGGTPKMNGNGAHVINNGGQSAQKSKLIDPTLPLTKQNPPPCNEYYILGRCPRATNCRYSHEYELTPEMIVQLSKSAKKIPCGAARKGIQCTLGESCVWGHSCPKGPTCFHYSQGKCWFKSVEAHVDKDKQEQEPIVDSATPRSPLDQIAPEFPMGALGSILRQFGFYAQTQEKINK